MRLKSEAREPFSEIRAQMKTIFLVLTAFTFVVAHFASAQDSTVANKSAKIGKFNVRLFGNAAVVIGTSTEKGTDSRGVSFNRVYRRTNTWILRNGAWQCVASQSAQVPR